MFKILSKFLGKSDSKVPSVSGKTDELSSNSDRTTGRRTPPIELDWSKAEYVPLPPSPPSWEVDGRDEFHRLYNDPVIGPVLQANLKRQHTKVVKLAVKLTSKQCQGKVGEVIAKAYRKLITQRMKAGQFAAAAKQCMEMFVLVPGEINNVDKRRYNRAINQINKMGKKHAFTPMEVTPAGSEPVFKISESSGWVLNDVRKLQNEERPDPAFEIVAVNGLGTWLFDQSGKSSGLPYVRSVLRRLDRSGHLVAEIHMKHDAYRTSSVALGANFAIMDSEGRLHVYDSELNLLVETDLRKDHRVVDHFRTIETKYWGEFRTQIRAVDMDPAGDRFIFTLADEAWCCTPSGITLWGVMMPLNKGWKRVGHFGIDREIEEALDIFGLKLPVSPAEIKHKYWNLAKVHHPDRNPNDSCATERMRSIIQAFKVLTGVDPTTLAFEESDITYFARTDPSETIDVGGIRFEVTTSGGTPQDWVYAASCSTVDDGVFIGTYSGKVILLSGEGTALVVYDIGTCPIEIVEKGRYLYFLTATRLYVVEDRTKLAAFLDVYQQGRLIVSEAGFGLLTSKTLQWFTSDGRKTGELVTRDPIRGISISEYGVIVQSRQHQAEVQGLVIS